MGRVRPTRVTVRTDRDGQPVVAVTTSQASTGRRAAAAAEQALARITKRGQS